MQQALFPRQLSPKIFHPGLKQETVSYLLQSPRRLVRPGSCWPQSVSPLHYSEPVAAWEENHIQRVLGQGLLRKQAGSTPHASPSPPHNTHTYKFTSICDAKSSLSLTESHVLSLDFSKMKHVKMSAGWQQKGTSTHKAHKYKHPETLNQKKKPVRPQASTPTHPYPTPPHPMSAAICRVLG